MIDLDTVDIGHSKQTGCGKLSEHLRAGDIGNVFLVFIKPHQIVRFSYKIHLFLRGFPKFIQYRIKIDQVTGSHGNFHDFGGFF